MPARSYYRDPSLVVELGRVSLRMHAAEDQDSDMGICGASLGLRGPRDAYVLVAECASGRQPRAWWDG